MSLRRTALIVGTIAAAGVLMIGCSNDSSSKNASGATTTTAASASASTAATVGNALPPIVITPQMAKEGGTTPVPTIHVGDSVVFNMGTLPVGGNMIIATNSNPSAFKVTGEGSNNGTVAMNAGGTALAVGTATVSLGSTKPMENFAGTYVLVITAK